MEHIHDHEPRDSCCTSDTNSGLRQTLSEMEFERGIWYAAQCNDLARARSLLRKGTLANVEDAAGYTALHYAARNGHRAMCELLLENGAKIDATTRSGHATALQRAATQGHVEVVELLLESGADANLRDADGCTALHRALRAASKDVCELLIPRTNLRSADKSGRSLEQLLRETFEGVLPPLPGDLSVG